MLVRFSAQVRFLVLSVVVFGEARAPRNECFQQSSNEGRVADLLGCVTAGTTEREGPLQAY